MKAGEAGRGRQRGFTFLAMLIALALVGVGLAVLGESWQVSSARAREAELLFAGNQYRRAIAAYYRQPLAPGRLPERLEDLLHDPRTPSTTRYLRRLFPDPITGSAEWGLVNAPDGGIMGMHSLSAERPLKSAGFRTRDKEFENTEKYSDWKFVFTPPLQLAPKPAVKPATTR